MIEILTAAIQTVVMFTVPAGLIALNLGLIAPITE